jgi:hypothetical protein
MNIKLEPPTTFSNDTFKYFRKHKKTEDNHDYADDSRNPESRFIKELFDYIFHKSLASECDPQKM